MEEPMCDLSQPFSRRGFLAGTSCFGAFYALAKLIPVPALAADVAADARVSEVPLGFPWTDHSAFFFYLVAVACYCAGLRKPPGQHRNLWACACGLALID